MNVVRFLPSCRFRLVSVIVPFLLSSVSAEGLSAQSASCRGIADELRVRTLRWEVAACSECIELSQRLLLGEEDGPGYLERRDPDMAMDGLGRYWVLDGEGAKVYSANGTFFRRVGQAGEGPGEFVFPSEAVPDAKGGMHIFDGENLRVTTFRPDLSLENTASVSGLVVDAASLVGDSALAVNMVAYKGGLIGRSLHVLNTQTWEAESSFAVTPDGNPLLTEMKLTIGRDGRIMAGSLDDYTVSVWHPDGTPVECLRREGLFEARPSHGLSTTRPGQIPEIHGFVQDIHVDASDRLWVSAWVPREGWRENVIRVERPDRPPRFTSASAEALYVNVLEVIDIERGLVIAHLELDTGPYVVGFLNDSTVYGTVFSESGAPLLRVSTVTFHPAGD